MKKNLKILGVAIFTFHIALGQEAVTYDFKTKLIKIEDAKHGQTVVFKIDSINRFLYEVKITSKQIEFISEPSTMLNKALLNTEKLNSSGVEKSVENAKQTSQHVAWIERYTTDRFQSKIDMQFITITEGLITSALNVHNHFENLEKSKVLKNRLFALTQTNGLTYDKSISKTNDLCEKFPFIECPEDLIISFDKAYKHFEKTYILYILNPIVIDKFKDDVTMKSRIDTIYNEVESLKKVSSRDKFEEIFKNINTLYAELRNSDNFRVISNPVQAEKDFLIFDVEITPRNDIPKLVKLESRIFSTTVPIKGGFKIDYSTGLFITKGLHHRAYSTNQSPQNNLNSIISENKNNSVAQLSIGALMHISPRSTNNIKPGFTFGLGLITSEISNTNVFIGASAMIGSKEKVIISAGLALANVDYLNGKYNLNTEYETASLDTNLTEKVLRASWFVSLTYNLSNLKND